MSEKPTFGSLFSGIPTGGLDLGLERAGWRCAFQVENDPYCQRVLAKHWPTVPRWGDIREVNADDLPRVDLLAGGFPCQDIARVGRRAGIDGAKSGLWGEFARLIRGLRPDYVLVENTTSLLVRGIERVTGDLAACGYDAEWDCLPAAAFGAPHIRDRLYLLAYPGRGRHGAPQAPVFAGRPGAQLPRGWPPEPDVGRVVMRPAAALDGGLAGHEECHSQASAAGLPDTVRLRALREYLASTAPSPEPGRCAYCGHPLSALPCRGACSPWQLGGRAEAHENLLCLREGLLGLLAQHGEDVQPYLSLGGRTPERAETMVCTQHDATVPLVPERVSVEARTPDNMQPQLRQQIGLAETRRRDRLRGLGNAVVPQVGEWLGRRLLEAIA